MENGWNQLILIRWIDVYRTERTSFAFTINTILLFWLSMECKLQIKQLIISVLWCADFSRQISQFGCFDCTEMELFLCELRTRHSVHLCSSATYCHCLTFTFMTIKNISLIEYNLFASNKHERLSINRFAKGRRLSLLNCEIRGRKYRAAPWSDRMHSKLNDHIIWFGASAVRWAYLPWITFVIYECVREIDDRYHVANWANNLCKSLPITVALRCDTSNMFMFQCRKYVVVVDTKWRIKIDV